MGVAIFLGVVLGGLITFVSRENVNDLRHHLTLWLVIAIVAIINIVSFLLFTLFWMIYRWIKQDLDPVDEDLKGFGPGLAPSSVACSMRRGDRASPITCSGMPSGLISTPPKPSFGTRGPTATTVSTPGINPGRLVRLLRVAKPSAVKAIAAVVDWMVTSWSSKRFSQHDEAGDPRWPAPGAMVFGQQRHLAAGAGDEIGQDQRRQMIVEPAGDDDADPRAATEIGERLSRVDDGIDRITECAAGRDHDGVGRRWREPDRHPPRHSGGVRRRASAIRRRI